VGLSEERPQNVSVCHGFSYILPIKIVILAVFGLPPKKMGQQNISILLVSCIHLFGNYYIHLYPTNMVQQKTHLSRLTPPLGPFPSLVVLVLRQDSRRPKDRMGFAAPRPWKDDQEQELIHNQYTSYGKLLHN